MLSGWGKILKINCWPIFDIARRILEHVPVAEGKRLIERLAETADRLLAERFVKRSAGSWFAFRLLKRTGHNTLPCPVSRQIRLANDRDKVHRDAHSDSVTEAHWKTTTGRTDST